jgi:hypothetical protein
VRISTSKSPSQRSEESLWSNKLKKQNNDPFSYRQTASSLTQPSTALENWLTPYYQYANRLAAFYFLMEECRPAFPIKLMFIYFYGDSRNDGKCPQSPLDWKPVPNIVENHLSIDHNSKLYERIHHLFMPVNPGQDSP